jgi:hypothetical protein
MTKQEKRTFFAGFCILIVLAVSIAACTTPDSGTNNPITSPNNPTTTAKPQREGAVSVTINTAEKMPKLNNLSPLGGGIFLVLNITVKNNDVQEGFDFASTSLTLLDTESGELIPVSLNAKPGIRKELGSSLLQPARIGQQQAVTGQVVFDVADSKGYRLDLVDAGKTVLTSLPVTFENQIPARNPVTLTINSARKLARVNDGEGLHTRDGNIFVVLDITVKNNGVKEGFDFTNASTTLLNLESSKFASRSSNFLNKMDKPPENPVILPTKIAQNEAITGQIIFRIYDSTEYRLNLIDNDKKVLTSLPVSFKNLATADHPVSVTVHSVEKRYTLNEIRTGPGEVFVLINMTVKNNDLPRGFYFYQGSTTLRDLASGRNVEISFNEKKDYGEFGVEQAFVLPKTIKQNDAITGKTVFALNNSDRYLMNLVDNNYTIILSRMINVDEPQEIH